MRRRWPLLGCVAVAWLGACGAGDDATLSASCTDRAQVEEALAAAPAAVVLADGTTLSDCIRGATSSALLQNLGVTLTAVAEGYEDDPGAATRLGYLIGAARRGSTGSSGQGAELVRRLERSGSGVSAAPELLRGLRAGERTG